MFLRLLIIFIIVAIAGAVFYNYNRSDDDTSPLLRGLAKVRSLAKEAAPEPPVETAVYKWQDKNGEWHFSNQPPPEGVAADVTVYRSDVNVTPAPKADTPQENTTANPATNPTNLPLLPLTDPTRIKQLIDDAKNVQNLADDRQQQIDQKTSN